MAISKNILFAGMSGKLGLLVFRQRNGKTVVSLAPGERTTKPTARQAQVREKFLRASQIAIKALEDPILKKQYDTKAARTGYSAYNCAMKDAFKHI